jgi:hypothetical protein
LACSLEAKLQEVPSSRPQLLKALHRRAADLKAEVRECLHRHCSEIVIKPVRRAYAFEDDRVPRGRQWLLKVTCNAAPGAIPASTAGRTFSAVLGTAQTPLEAVLLKRRLMGPSWLQLHGAELVDPAAQTSWCKVRSAAHRCAPAACLRPPARPRGSRQHRQMTAGIVEAVSCARVCDLTPAPTSLCAPWSEEVASL